MRNIRDGLPKMKIVMVRGGFGQDLQNGNWMVFDHPQGKVLIDSLLQVGILLPWESIKALEEQSNGDCFDWGNEDGSFTVQEKDGRWKLVFKMTEPPYSVITASLTSGETKMLKERLFKEKA